MKTFNENEVKQVKGSVNVGVDAEGNVWNLKTKRIMKPYINVGNGYCYVHVLYEGNDKPTAKSVHRLVLETFEGLPEDKSKC